ncbi:MAG TPA: hypothetical protein VN721_15900, partial [Flavipsychrobacter sp.]|nr:hypothetical protein [Flavipsychrobacter sp.]
YYGLGVYRMEGVYSGAWAGAKEILSQIKDIRHLNNNATGYSFYSASCFDKVSPSLRDSLHYSYNNYFALPPTMKWLDSIPPAAPVLKAIPSSQGTLLQWQVNNPTKEPLRFAVYRFINNEPVNLDKADKILSVQSLPAYIDVNANKYQQCTYIVTALDRLWNESKPSNKAITNSNE